MAINHNPPVRVITTGRGSINRGVTQSSRRVEHSWKTTVVIGLMFATTIVAVFDLWLLASHTIPN